MAEPIREQILAKVVARLQTITVANGYHQDVMEVSRVDEPVEAPNDLPKLYVWAANDENEKDYAEMDGGVIGGAMGVEIAIYAQGTDAVLLSTAIERLVADIEVALTTEGPPGLTPNLHLGLGVDVVRDVHDTGRFVIMPIPSRELARGIAGVLYRVAYDYTIGHP